MTNERKFLKAMQQHEKKQILGGFYLIESKEKKK